MEKVRNQNKIDWDAFWDRLNKIRSERYNTLEGFAEALGLKYQQLNKWFRDKPKAQIRTLARIAASLQYEVDLQWLFFGEGEPYSSIIKQTNKKIENGNGVNSDITLIRELLEVYKKRSNDLEEQKEFLQKRNKELEAEIRRLRREIRKREKK